MPDAGGYEPGTHEGGRTPRSAHVGWGDRFAALPLESPDENAWQRVHSRLSAPATPSRKRWPLWLATAASLALVAVIPLRMLTQASPADVVPATPEAIASPSSPAAQTAAVPAGSVALSTSSPSTAEMQPAAVPVADRDRPRRAARDLSSPKRPIRSVAQSGNDTAIATTDASAPTDLDPLYAQSAQLEGLLALARDDRVASGTSAALSDGLDTALANIDAALIEAGLDDTRLADLWRQRVDTLQQLVGIETTNRLYAARGQRYDAALVSID